MLQYLLAHYVLCVCSVGAAFTLPTDFSASTFAATASFALSVALELRLVYE